MTDNVEEVLSGVPPRKSTPVRRFSNAAGRCEGRFWRRTSRNEVQKVLLAAKRFELVERKGGCRNGPLGPIAIEVLELLANMVSFKTGQLDPSIDTLMRRIKRSRDAIVRALKALRTYGFLDWLRRYEATGNVGRGPQVRQVSNAYRISMPPRAERLLGRWSTQTPIPDDFAHAIEMRRGEMEEHRNGLAMEELPLFDLGDTPLGRSLARLALAMKEREFAKRSESNPT